MSIESITVENGMIRVDQRTLDAKTTSPNELHAVLVLGRHAIQDSIELSYEQTKQSHPGHTVGRQPISAISFGADPKRLRTLSLYGRANNTSIHRARHELHQDVQPYWDAVEAADFTPEVKSRLGPRNVTELYVRAQEQSDIYEYERRDTEMYLRRLARLWSYIVSRLEAGDYELHVGFPITLPDGREIIVTAKEVLDHVSELQTQTKNQTKPN